MEEEVEEVCPTEDMFMALMNTLLRPHLSSSLPHSPFVANQMHAIVLLYNYYHRKRHPTLEYLNFTSCCQLAVIFCPILLQYMKHMHQPHYNTLLLDPNAQLSLTEQVIMNACKVSFALFALGDVPASLGWPVSKVSVLLVDSTRENCFLLFDSITKGIWSPIERDVDFSAAKSPSTVDQNSTSEIRKCSRLLPATEVPNYEDALLQLAFSAIKEIAGIDNTDLEVLESHAVYSLNDEKTAAHFFIVQSSQSISEEHQVNLKGVIESLQGPLVRKSSCGWKLMTAHQYFHLLPYTGILSDWFSREQLLKHLRESVEYTVTKCSNSTENHQKNEVIMDKNNTHENRCPTDMVNNEASNGSHDPTKQELYDGSSHHIFVPEKVDGGEFYKDASSNVKVSHPIEETTAMEIDKDVLPTEINLLQDKVDADMFGSVNINHSITKIDSMEIDKYVPPIDINLVAPKTNSATRITSKVFKGAESKSSRISSSSRDSEASGNHAVDSQQLNSIKVEKPTCNLALDEDPLQQASLKPLLEKREKLSVQRSSIEEELALCESHIQTFLNGDASDIEVKMQAVIEFCDYISTNRTTESQDGSGLRPCQPLEDPVALHAKRKHSPVSILPMQHPFPESCKELDIFCCMNKWMLPTYCVLSSHDGFHADVKVLGGNLALSERSDLKTTPAEARASAAVKMMDLLDRVLPKQ
ncbi:uncharacterized protein LOC141677504 isoform X2 [Apium graveolens]|uniref:uncharacterized protein LOC141677504 isoform X2 n=1 Tax=Apium graveolens TaxID=4045 RepID=UPI003D7B7662